jgi:ferredoxin
MTELATPIDQFLATQRDLSAAERFASEHGALDRPLNEDWYRALMPATPPGEGQQYRFEVDLAACTGCKSCVAACHSLNGLDEGESWRRTGTLLGVGPSGPTQQTVTTACHHCVDPACLTGCPVDAYEKDPVTGIVRDNDSAEAVQHLPLTCSMSVTYARWVWIGERTGLERGCERHVLGPVYRRDVGWCIRNCVGGCVGDEI